MSSTTIGTSAGILTSNGGSSPLQITGLATGLNTNEIIQAELAEDEAPITNMQAQVSGLTTMNNTLTSIQSSLQTVALDAQSLADPTLFSPSQSVSSSNPDLVTATTPNGIGGVIGGSSVTVTQLASAAQRTFTFTSPAAADTITVDGQQVSLKAGATSQDLANAINSNSDMDVWAAATSSGQIVLSTRTTGDNGTNFIQVTDPGGTLAEQTALAQNGQDAQYTINGVSGSSTTDTVTGAIPGVTLTLNGVTATDAPVTIDVQQPTTNVSAIETAVNQFVSDYNSAVNSIESSIDTEPTNTSNGGTFDQDAGSLFGDPDLEDLLDQMRTAMYSPGSGLPTGMAAMTDLGISTGSSTGAIQQNSVNGDLTVNTSALAAAIQSNPSGVQQVLQQWSQSFYNIVNDSAGAGGSIASRITGDSTQITMLNDQISSMQTLYQQQEQDMQEQWASVEATLSNLQSQSSAFTATTNAGSSTSSSSSSSSSSSG